MLFELCILRVFFWWGGGCLIGWVIAIILCGGICGVGGVVLSLSLPLFVFGSFGVGRCVVYSCVLWIWCIGYVVWVCCIGCIGCLVVVGLCGKFVNLVV